MKNGTYQNPLVKLIGIRRRICSLVGITALALLCGINPAMAASSTAKGSDSPHWIGTWGTAAQPSVPGHPQVFRNQTLRLIVHTSAGGKEVRIKISNTFGDQPLVIGGAHIARRVDGAKIDPGSDRILTFRKHSSTTIPARSMAVSDPVVLDFPALSDLAVSIFLPDPTSATTDHALALQTNYVSPETGDHAAEASFPIAEKIGSWPFLTGVDVAASPGGVTIVALGSSLTDGDGSTEDANRRWPDVLAERLQKNGGAELGVLNEGIIGNRLLSDSQSPHQRGGPPPLAAFFQQVGPLLGEAGLARFERDVLGQAGVKYVILALGVNDILFPGAFVPATESVTTQDLIAGYRQLVARAHQNGIRAIGTTIPPFEKALFRQPFFDRFYSPDNEKTRQAVNAWILSSREFDGVIDFDAAVRDPARPTGLLPAYDSGDHLHPNDSGDVAEGNAIPLTLFHARHPLPASE
ncbi:MAG: SGNH/GDSL hydrolase family protein [Terriglobia bacterium]|jgi:lysophospholipase L1-like esterase